MIKQGYMYNSITGSFKFQTTFVDVPITEIKRMITDYSKVKKIKELSDRIEIIWDSDVEWASQVYEYLGYQVLPRLEYLGQNPVPISYELG